MTHKQRFHILADLEWYADDTAGRNQICGEHCQWIHGTIESVKWSAWISTVSGMVYLHTSPAVDLAFDAFCETVRNGWPKPKVVPAARGLFDLTED